MFRQYRVLFRELVFITSSSYISISIAAVGNTYITWRGNEYELPEDDTIVSKHVGA
jgi:hypothetical protein